VPHDISIFAPPRKSQQILATPLVIQHNVFIVWWWRNVQSWHKYLTDNLWLWVVMNRCDHIRRHCCCEPNAEESQRFPTKLVYSMPSLLVVFFSTSASALIDAYLSLAWRSQEGAVQAVCNGPPMSAAQAPPQYMIDCCVYTSDIARRQHSGPPAAVSCLCRDTAVRCSVVGPFLWPTRRPGTRYQTTFEIRRVTRSVDSFRRDLKTLLFSFY